MGMIGSYDRLRPVEVEMWRTLRATDQRAASDYVDQLDGAWRMCDLDKLWEAIEYLVDAAGGPDLSPLMGDEDFDDTDVLFNPESVCDIAARLDAVSTDRFMAVFDPELLNARNVYPANYTPDDANDLRDLYEEVVRFFARAAADGDWVKIGQS
ncbi:DUF1877 family protein [Plantactinospora sp. GCM10030261]|uniref:DUF1877 family protein n=1 Tax=Plantactinospora sp. GCM10030261 TaxID=3273420 RepID=UPI00360F469F